MATKAKQIHTPETVGRSRSVEGSDPEEDASVASGGSQRKVEFCDTSNTIVEHDETWGSDDDSSSILPSKAAQREADADLSLSGSPHGSILRTGSNGAQIPPRAAKPARSLTTRSVAVQVCIPMDKDATVDMLNRMQQEAEESIEALEVQLRRATVEREQFRRQGESVAKALELVSAQKLALERREVELNRTILRLKRERRSESGVRNRDDSSEGHSDSIMSLLRSLDERLAGALSLNHIDPSDQRGGSERGGPFAGHHGEFPPHPFAEASPPRAIRPTAHSPSPSVAQHLLSATMEVGQRVEALQRQTSAHHSEMLSLMKWLRRDHQRRSPDTSARRSSAPGTAAQPTTAHSKPLAVARTDRDGPPVVPPVVLDRQDPSSSEWSSSDSEREPMPTVAVSRLTSGTARTSKSASDKAGKV